MLITFGKHRGNDISVVPFEYLEWGSRKLESPKWRKAFEDEIQKRRDCETKFRQSLWESPDDPELIKQLESRFLKEIDQEIEDSGCSWEYDGFDIASEVKSRVESYLFVLKTDKKIEELNQKYKKMLGISQDKLDLILRIETIDPERFSSQERFELAAQYVKKYWELANDEYWLNCNL